MNADNDNHEVAQPPESDAVSQVKPEEPATDSLACLEKIEAQTTAISVQLHELQQQFVSKIQKDSSQKQAFDKLYEEMRQYKDDFIFAAMRPILADLLLLYDNMVRAERNWEDDRGREIIADLREELVEILYRQDVEPICIADNATLDRRRQRVIQTVATNDACEDGQIVRVVREGFLRGERVLRPQEVVCKKSRQQKEHNHE